MTCNAVRLAALVGLVISGGRFGAAAEPGGDAAGMVQTFADESALKNWSFSDGAEFPGAAGSVEFRAGAGRSGDGAAVLTWNFQKGGNYVAAMVDLPTEPEVRAVRLWLHKPSANLVTFRAVDRDDETFQKNLRYHYPGWQELEISLACWVHSWGGDGQYHGPPRQLHILVENDGGTPTGELIIDDLRLLTAGSTDEGADAVSTYTESAFASPDGWRYSGAEGGVWQDGAWSYRLSTVGQRCGLVYERGLLGRPESMRVRLISDGSGHEVVAHLGSHFQHFERSLGLLTEVGTVGFEIPLGDLKTWRHFAGEDDGIVRYPLQLIEIALVRRGSAETGQIRPLGVEVTTRFDPRTELVSLVPSVRPADPGAQFGLELRSLASTALAGTVQWALEGVDRSLRDGKADLVVPPAGARYRWGMSADMQREGLIEGRFRFVSPGFTSPEASVTLAASPQGDFDRTLHPESRIGAGLYLYRFRGNPEGRKWMERMCALAARAGVRWTREEFHWNWIEARKGEWDFEFFDTLVDTAQAHGISVYALCCYWTQWTKSCTEEGIADYCRYLEQLVRRYGDRIKYWEIWNEPNIFFWSCPREMYARLLAEAYKTIKRVDPQAVVLGCSTAGVDTTFVRMVMDQQGPFDALTIHPYRGTLDPRGFIAELQGVRELVGGRDVWITEMGWPSHIGGLSERAQAGYVARTYISALASGAVRSVAWYDFREDGADPFFNEHHFGLVRHDLTPKIGYLALAGVGQLLGTAECAGSLDLGEDLYAWQFRRGDERVVALWSPRTQLASFGVEPEGWRIHNVSNLPARMVRTADSATLLLEADLPVYVLGGENLQIRRRPAPVVLELSRPAAHPGETVEVALRRKAEGGGPEFRRANLRPPPGWPEPRETAAGRWELRIPANAAPGGYDLILPVTCGEETFMLPARVEVAAALIRA